MCQNSWVSDSRIPTNTRPKTKLVRGCVHQLETRTLHEASLRMLQAAETNANNDTAEVPLFNTNVDVAFETSQRCYGARLNKSDQNFQLKVVVRWASNAKESEESEAYKYTEQSAQNETLDFPVVTFGLYARRRARWRVSPW